jgi:hypothetical protein
MCGEIDRSSIGLRSIRFGSPYGIAGATETIVEGFLSGPHRIDEGSHRSIASIEFVVEH